MDKTLVYYNKNAKEFIQSTISVDFSEHQQKFIKKVKGAGRILDFGCGSGRDTKYFLENGFDVTAIDGSEELCRMASEYTGIPVKHMLFQELNDINQYDGIWACSSTLHLSKESLSDVFKKMRNALKLSGIIYTSFKYGTFEGKRNDRYFTDFTEKTFEEYLSEIPGLVVEEEWVTSDVRPGREEEKWLNVFLRRQK